MAVVNCEHEAPVRQMADLGYMVSACLAAGGGGGSCQGQLDPKILQFRCDKGCGNAAFEETGREDKVQSTVRGKACLLRSRSVPVTVRRKFGSTHG